MRRKKTLHQFRQRMIAGLCSVCLAATGIPTLLPQASYAAETTDTTDANGLPVLGLSANLFCLSDTADATNANLQWADSIDKSTLDHYEVQRATDGVYQTIYQTTGCLFQDYDLALNQVYHYQVLAIGSDGAVLATSNAAALTPCSVSSDLDTHSNLTGGELNYATGGTKVGDTYYSYSMKSENNVSWLVESTSTDGKTFGNERTVADQSQNADLGSCKLESVQMKYIEKANKMIIWAHWEKPSGYADGKALVITGTPGGAFTVHHIYNPLDIQVRDMSIFVDDDGTGYLIAATSKGSEGANHTMRIFKMNSEYSDVTEVTKELFIGQYREFPNMTKRDGYYYLFTSQAAGWYPSQGAYAVTKQISGDWSALRNIGNTSTFSCQSGWIQSVGDKGNCVMHAYRWLRSGDTPGTHLCPMYFANGYAFYDYCTSFRYSTATGELYPVQQGRLLSLNKPSLASISAKGADKGTTFYASNAFDGDYQSCFSSDNKTWPFSLQVDLEHVCDLSNVQISWYMCKGSEAYYTYYIEGSTDGKNWTKLLDRTDTSADRVSKTYGFTSDELTGTARYVKLTVTNARPQNNPDNNWYSPTVYEVKVFGTPSSDPADTEQISRDPLAYYPLRGAQNGAVEDVMGNKEALQVHGNYRFIKDADNPMLCLDGSDGTYASLPDGLLDGIDDFSISFRAKPEQENKENFFTLGIGIDSSKYFLVKTATDATRFAITKTDELNNGWKGESGSKSTAPATDWARYTVVVHGDMGYLYRDNTLIASAILNQRLSELGEHLTGYIGKSFYSDDAYFKGSISGIAFYDYALSSEQIQNMVGVVYEKEHHCEDGWISDSTTHKRKCTLCGGYVDEAAHIFPKEYEVVKEPTCTETGYGVFYCEVCHYASEKQALIPAKGHTFGEWEVVTPATSKEEGEERRTCRECGYVETRSIDKQTDEEHTEPSSSQPSSDASKPGDNISRPSDDASKPSDDTSKPNNDASGPSDNSSKPSNDVSRPSNDSSGPSNDSSGPSNNSSGPSNNSSGPSNHTSGPSNDASEPSSDSSGPSSDSSGPSNGSSKPSYNVSEPSNNVSKPSAGSSVSRPGDNSSVSAPGDDNSVSGPSAGSSVSKPSDNASVSKPGSGSQKPSNDAEPPSHTHTPSKTWSFDEDSHWHTCTSCDSTAALNRASHTFGSWKTVKEATCTKDGERARTCTVCGYTQTMTLPALSHEYTSKWQSDASEHYHVCTICGEKIDAAEHTFVWTVDKEATASTDGIRHQECTVCGYIGKEESIPKGHTHTYTSTWFYDTDSHYHVCNECGVADTKIAHNFGNWVTTKEPSLTQEGQRTRTCLVCGYKQTEPIAALTPSTSKPSVDVPSSPSNDAPNVSSNPSKDAPSIPSSSSVDTPSVPSNPSGDIPSIPSNPSDDEPSIPSEPSDDTPSQSVEKPLAKNATAKVKVKGATYTYKVTKAKTDGSGTVTLTKTTSASTMSVPDKVKLKGHYYKVTAIDAKAFQKKTTVTSITIGSNVTKIPDSAFVGCKKLQKITLGTGITKIGEKAFQNDAKLKTITIRSKKLKTIGSKAFKGIYSKATFTVPSSKKNSYQKMLTSSKGFTKKMKLKSSKS